MATIPNLFARLHKWASRQDENFLTESLAVILELLLERVPAQGARLVKALTNDFIDVDADSCKMLEIQTQVPTTEGRPDLEIRIPARLAVIEVKVEAELRPGQLEGYREYLRTSGFPQTFLVLLTKYPQVIPDGAERPDKVIRWHEIAEQMESELPELDGLDSICHFVCLQFLDYLKERNMKLAQVGWQLSEGTRALGSFLVMLQEAANACRMPAKKSMSLESAGFTLDGKYWIGLVFDDPGKLWFNTHCRINPEAARQLGEGTLWNKDEMPGGVSWCRSGDLESEEIHFFNRTKVGQIQWIEKFLGECRDMARRIESPDQPPVPPAQPEE